MIRLIIILAFVAVPAFGEGYGANTPPVEYCHRLPDTGQPHCHKDKPTDQPSKPCCEICRPGGKACGNTCVSEIMPCEEIVGCACNPNDLPFKKADPERPPASACCVTCWKKKACGNGCIPANEKCTKPKGCACDLQF